MKIDKAKLMQKGWSADEVKKTERLAKKNESAAVKTQIMVYWFIIFAMIILTLLMSMWLIPFFMVLEGPTVFFLLLLLGLCFGAMFNNLITNLEHLERKHYFFAGLIMPIVAIASLAIIVKAAAFAAAQINLSIRQNPWLVSAFYILGFLIPYFYGVMRQNNQGKIVL